MRCINHYINIKHFEPPKEYLSSFIGKKASFLILKDSESYRMIVTHGFGKIWQHVQFGLTELVINIDQFFTYVFKWHRGFKFPKFGFFGPQIFFSPHAWRRKSTKFPPFLELKQPSIYAARISVQIFNFEKYPGPLPLAARRPTGPRRSSFAGRRSRRQCNWPLLGRTCYGGGTRCSARSLFLRAKGTPPPWGGGRGPAQQLAGSTLAAKMGFLGGYGIPNSR